MGKLFPDVRPGDLITAADWMALAAQVEKLTDLIEELQASVPSAGAVTITSVLPLGPLRIGTEVHVIGTNFGFSTGASRLFVTAGASSVPVNSFKLGSNDSQLIFNLPSVPGVVSTGTPGRFIVSNAGVTAERDIIILPAQDSLIGSVDVVFMDVTPNQFAAGDKPDFRFTAKARTNIDARYVVTPSIKVASNQSAWEGVLVVLDDAKRVLTDREIKLAAGETGTFYIRIDKVPGSPNNAKLGLSAQVSSGSVSGASGQQNFQVGHSSPQPDTTISMSVQGADFDPANSGKLEVGSSGTWLLKIPTGGLSLLTLVAEFTVAGKYDVGIGMLEGNTDWDVTINDQSTVNPIPINSVDLATLGRVVRNPEFVIKPKVASATAGTFECSLKRQGAVQDRTLRVDVQRV
jgi:hypothetical protein